MVTIGESSELKWDAHLAPVCSSYFAVIPKLRKPEECHYVDRAEIN